MLQSLVSKLTGATSRGATPAAPRQARATAVDRALDAAAIHDYHSWVGGACKRLRLKDTVSVDDVIGAVERYLGCIIKLTMVDWEGAELYGAVCADGALSYVIALRHDLTNRQRIKTIYHELAHILRGHTAPSEPQFRGFEPSTWQDIEAEEIARLLMARTLHERQAFLERFIERMGGVDA